MAELVEIDSARENRVVGMLLRMSSTPETNQTGFWTGGIVRQEAHHRSLAMFMNKISTV
jgi:hypothetical protein